MNLEGFADPSIPATQDNWTLYRATGKIPSSAQSASVVIRGAVPVASVERGTDAYVDLISLKVVPEPSSLLLLLLTVSTYAAVVAAGAARQGDALTSGTELE